MHVQVLMTTGTVRIGVGKYFKKLLKQTFFPVATRPIFTAPDQCYNSGPKIIRRHFSHSLSYLLFRGVYFRFIEAPRGFRVQYTRRWRSRKAELTKRLYYTVTRDVWFHSLVVYIYSVLGEKIKKNRTVLSWWALRPYTTSTISVVVFAVFKFSLSHKETRWPIWKIHRVLFACGLTQLSQVNADNWTGPI